jgi:hypothetical protein
MDWRREWKWLVLGVGAFAVVIAGVATAGAGRLVGVLVLVGGLYLL